MPSRIKLWIDPFAALQNLRDFLAARASAARRAVSKLARAGRPLASWLRHARTAARSREERTRPAKLELEPMDWRNPPSENIATTALPLAATAAAAAATAYLVAAWQSEEVHAGAIAERVALDGFDRTQPVVAALTLDSGYDVAVGSRLEEQLPPTFFASSASAPEEVTSSAAAAVDGAGSTLSALREDDFGFARGGGGSGGGDGGGSESSTAGSGSALGGGGAGDPGTTGGSAGPTGGATGGAGTDFGAAPVDPDFFPGGMGAGGQDFFPAGAGTAGEKAPASGSGVGHVGGGTESNGPSGGEGGGGAEGGNLPQGGEDGPGYGSSDGIFGRPELRPGRQLLGDSSEAPVRFVTNQGQWAEGIDFTVRGSGYQVALTRDYAEVALARDPTEQEKLERGDGVIFDALRLEWTDLRPGVTAQGEGQLSSVSNFLLGNDSQQWHTNVPEFGAVRYADAWNGIDLVYRGASDKQVEYDLVVRPGASPDAIGFTLRGADARVDEQGRLVLTAASGNELTQSAPVVYQLREDGSRDPVSGSYRLRQDGSVGFTVGPYDPTRELVIDPVLSYATALSGSGTEVAYGVAVDDDGNAYAVGTTSSALFATTGTYDTTLGGSQDAFVGKLDSTGGVLWKTYLGGIGIEQANAVALDSQGRPVVAGQTASSDFPTASAYDSTANGTTDAFLTKLSSDGTTLVFSTYFGAASSDQARGVAVDRSSDEVAIVGDTVAFMPGSFPTTHAYQSTRSGTQDAFITRFTSSGSDLVFSTLLGGSSSEIAYGVAIDSAGDTLVAGQTSSSSFPTTQAYDSTLGGTTDAFVSRFSSTGTLEQSTLYGGSSDESARAVAVDGTDRVYLTGTTSSSNLPVPNAVDSTLGGSQDAFVARFTSLSFAPEYATYQGGAGSSDAGYGIAADPDSRAVVTGTDGSALTLSRYAPLGTAVEWSTTYSSATGYAAAVMTDGSMFAAGSTGTDALVLKYGLPPAPVITTFTDDTGSSNSDKLTYDTTPTVSGTSSASATITLYNQSTLDASPTLLGTTTASAGGLWTYTLSAVSPDGVYQLTATSTVSGETSAVSAPLTFTLDTTAPDVSIRVDTEAGIQTYNRQPRVTVTATDLIGFPSPATVTLDADLNGDGDFADASETGFATAVLTNGKAVFTGYTPLTVGLISFFQARITDRAGNQGTSPIAAVHVIASTGGSPPAAPAITSFTTDTGSSNSDRITSDTTLVLSGTSTASALVTVFGQAPFALSPTLLGWTTASGGGMWSFTLPSATAEGLNTFTAKQTVAGATSASSTPFAVNVDVTAPALALRVESPTTQTAPPVAVTVVEAVGFPSPATVTLDVDLNNDNDFGDPSETGYATATLSGTSAIITGYTVLSVGTYHFRARVTDLAGNEGTSSTRTVQITSPPPPPGAPAAPAITTVADDTGSSNADLITKDTTLTFTGTAPASSSVALYQQGPLDNSPVLIATVAASAGGTWTYASTDQLDDAAYVYTARATVSSPPPPVTSYPSTPVAVTVDTTPPRLEVTVDPPRTTDTAPPVWVKAFDAVGFPSPATVTLDVDLNNDGDFADASESGYATATLSAARDATFSGYSALTAGNTYRFRARVTDLAGNEGAGHAVADILSAVWTPIDLTPQLRSGYGGMATWNADGLTYAGDVSAAQSIDLDLSPSAAGGQEGFLVYHSQEAAPAPVVQVSVRGDNALGVPNSVVGTLTWDGSAAGSTTYTLTPLTSGGDWVFAAAPSSGLSTGRHTYTLDLFVDYSGGANDQTLSKTGYTFVVNRSSSPYGAGWSFSNTDALVTIASDGTNPAGVLREFGSGGWAFYSGSGPYTSPPGDAGTLAAAGGGGWTYTSWDGTIRTFNSSGQMTGWASADGADLTTYTFDVSTGGVATVASPDTALATFAYSTRLSTVTAPGSRVTTAAYSGTDLTTLTDPAGGLHSFGYSSHRLATDKYGFGGRTYTYDGTGLAHTTQLGADNAGTITPGQSVGLSTAGQTSVPKSVPGSVANAAGQTTEGWFNSFGQAVQAQAADGGLSTSRRSADGWIVETTDPLGRRTSLEVNARGQVEREVRADGTTANWVYGGANGSLSLHTDFRSKTWTYTNDAYGQMTKATDPLNATTTYVWGTNPLDTDYGRLKSVTDPTNRTVTNLYDAYRRLEGALAGGAVTGTTVYDAYGFVGAVVDPRGNRTTYTNDKLGRPTTIQNALTDVSTVAYDAAGRVLWSINANSVTTSYGYDSAGRQTVLIEAYGNGTYERRTTSSYDPDTGRLKDTLDPLNRRTTPVYDAVGRVIAAVDPLGNRTTSVYDKAGQMTAMRDALGRVTAFGYDRLGRPESVTDAVAIAGGAGAAGGIATTVYDGNSNVVARVDQLGNRASTIYDAANRPAVDIDPEGNRTLYGYDEAGRLTSTTDPRGNTTTYNHNARGDLEQVMDPLGNYTQYQYDAADNLTTITDARHNVSTVIYDALNRAHSWIDQEGNRTSVVFDKVGNVVASVDAFGKRTTFQYDALDRQEAVIDVFNKRATTVYDAGDRVSAAVDQRGNRTTYTRDAMDRATGVKDALLNETSSSYDKVGNLRTSTDAFGKLTNYGYDGLNRLVTTTDPLGATGTTNYDKASRVLSAVDPLGNVTSYARDKAGRVTSAISAYGTGRQETVGYHYDAAGNRDRTTDAAGALWTSVFDALNRVIESKNPLLQTVETNYDEVGNVSFTVDARGYRTTFIYDKANRLVEKYDAAGGIWTTTYDKTRVLSTVDGLGNVTSYGYDDASRTTLVLAAYGAGLVQRTTSTFDDAGNLKTVTDPFNRTTTYEYDARNMRTSTQDGGGKLWTTQYDAAGRAWRTVDPLGRDRRTYFDAAGRAAETADGLGNRRTTAFDKAGNAVAAVDELGNRTTTSYDEANRPYVVIDALSRRMTTTYDQGRVLSVEDPRNTVTSYGYDAAGRTTLVLAAYGTGIQTRTSTTYDDSGNVRTVSDPLNRTTTSTSDGLNRKVLTEDANGKLWTVAYDKAGNLKAKVDPVGTNRATTYNYDALNRLSEVVDPEGNVTTTAYDGTSGRKEAKVDPRGNRTTFQYDSADRLEVVIDALSKRTTSVYDDAGQLIATVDPLGKRTTFQYDARGLQESVKDPLGNTSQTLYYATGRVYVTLDPLGNSTARFYDAVGRLEATADQLGYRTTSVFDEVGNRTALVDASGNRTTWVYDALSRATSEQDVGGTATFAYDGAGQLSSTTEKITSLRRDFDYTPTGLKKSEAWLTSGATVQLQTWTYDDAGRMLTAQDPDGTSTYQYDRANRVSRVDGPFGLVLTYGYDKAGNRTSVQDSTGGVTTVSFDALNRQQSEQTAGSGISAMRFDYAYTDRGQRLSVTRYSDLAGTTTVALSTYSYDDAGRLRNLKHQNGSGTVLANYTYSYDAASRLQTKVENGTTTTFDYDAARQLTQDGASTFSYDATGNRTNPGYATGTGNRITTDGVWTYTHDAEGNVTKKSKGASSDTWVYTFDHRNQMLTARFSATDGGAATKLLTYAYDAAGTRISRVAWDGTSTTTERYGYDGGDPAKPAALSNENKDAVVILDGSNVVVTRWAFGVNQDEVVARQTAAGAVSWDLGDRQQSVRLVIDNSATILATAVFDAYGKLTSGSIYDSYGYTGVRFDSLTSDYSNGRGIREYDPSAGLFLQRDPIWVQTGEANPFLYVHNSPTNGTDPSGEWIVAQNKEEAERVKAIIEAWVPGLTLNAPRQSSEGGTAFPWIIDEVADPTRLGLVAGAIATNANSAPGGGRDRKHTLLAALQHNADPHVDAAVLGVTFFDDFVDFEAGVNHQSPVPAAAARLAMRLFNRLGAGVGFGSTNPSSGDLLSFLDPQERHTWQSPKSGSASSYPAGSDSSPVMPSSYSRPRPIPAEMMQGHLLMQMVEPYGPAAVASSQPLYDRLVNDPRYNNLVSDLSTFVIIKQGGKVTAPFGAYGDQFIQDQIRQGCGLPSQLSDAEKQQGLFEAREGYVNLVMMVAAGRFAGSRWSATDKFLAGTGEFRASGGWKYDPAFTRANRVELPLGRYPPELAMAAAESYEYMISQRMGNRPSLLLDWGDRYVLPTTTTQVGPSVTQGGFGRSGGNGLQVSVAPNNAVVLEKLPYLTPAEFAALPASGTISPWRFRVSQDTASWNFKPPFQELTIGEAAYQLRTGGLSPSVYPPVQLVERNGMIWSVDNRRVLTFRSAGMEIQYEKTTWDALTAGQQRHFTSDTNGESIIILFPK